VTDADTRARLQQAAVDVTVLGPEHPAVFVLLIQLCLRFDCALDKAWDLVGRMARGDFSFDPHMKETADDVARHPV
jgi:hypothetical protein